MKSAATFRALVRNGLRHAEHVTIPVEFSALSGDRLLEHLPTGETGVLKGVLHTMANVRPEWRGAKGIEMQTGRAVPRPLQAAR
jgi:hypothetical protein